MLTVLTAVLGALSKIWASRLGREIVIGLGVLLVIYLGFHVWLRNHDDVVFRQGKETTANEYIKAKETELKAREQQAADKNKAAEAKLANLTTQQKVIAAQLASAEQLWRSSREALAKITAEAGARREVRDAQVDAIPAALLLDALRARSAELAAAKTTH